MDEKTLQTLEYPKILERLAAHCSFEASREKARALRPTPDLDIARRKQAVTSEACALLAAQPDISIGGARDLRAVIEAAARHVVLEPSQFLDIKYTLVAARNLRRVFERQAEHFPHLSEISLRLPPPLGLVDAISQTLSERGEVLDNASVQLAAIRRDLRIQHDRLLSRMQSMLSNPRIAPYLQDNLITQRDGRYVIPLRAEFKGKIQAVIHDSSASGATLFVEPLSVVEYNNKYRQLQLEEREEVRRVLAALSQQVGAHADVLIDMIAALANLDLAFACAKYAQDLEAFEPILLPFREPRPLSEGGDQEGFGGILHPGVTIQLRGARHPLLNPDTVVPVDVELDPQTLALVITGPNTGGKTVTLKTVGLLVLMAQSGLHIPADSQSKISVFRAVYADIGDEQSIEQSLSTFSGHINNIIHILKRADRHSLVILDELGAGTDPQEGAALARAILTHLLKRGITTLVTTHHPELKVFAHATPGVVNASVEFDLETLQPTYRLTIGLPGRSNALAIAERLGLPDEIVAAARAEINPMDLQAEDLLDEIHQQRDRAREARSAAEDARKEAERLRIQLASRLDELEDERRQVLEEARQEAEDRVRAVQAEITALRRELRRLRQPLDAISSLESRLEELTKRVEAPVERRVPDLVVPSGPIRLGAKVYLRTLGKEGVVTALGEEDAEVQVGMLRVRTRLAELELKGSPVTEAEKPSPEPRSTVLPSRHESPGVELDLRGQRVEDALDMLDHYLEKAYLAHLPWVRIIHGKGTGRLREVVRKALSRHPHVKSFEGGRRGEGGEGVTVAHLQD